MRTNPPDGSGVGALTPAGMLRAAVETVPALRYALGVGGLASVVAIVLLGWKLKAQDAIFGSLIVLILMVVLVVFAALAGIGRAALQSPALFLAWACTSLTVSVAILFVSCAFFDKPKTLPCLLRYDCRAMSGTLTPTSPSCSIAAGASSCNVNLMWSTTYPVDLSAVTSNYPRANWTVAFGNAGGPITVPVPYSSRRFYLYNNQQLLATSVATSICASGTAWNGSKCQTSAMSGTLTLGTNGEHKFDHTLTADEIADTIAKRSRVADTHGISRPPLPKVSTEIVRSVVAEVRWTCTLMPGTAPPASQIEFMMLRGMDAAIYGPAGEFMLQPVSPILYRHQEGDRVVVINKFAASPTSDLLNKPITVFANLTDFSAPLITTGSGNAIGEITLTTVDISVNGRDPWSSTSKGGGRIDGVGSAAVDLSLKGLNTQLR